MLNPTQAKAVSRWLLLCALLVALMVAVGGYTRLSGSGLSITSWKPLHGIIPPLSHMAWEEEFAAYRATPQFAKINPDMNMLTFQEIFWPEFLHRLLGRTVGIVFFLPFVGFALRRTFSRKFGVRLLAIFALGGLQGVMGWYMVKSGLVNDPYVSHLRLALHLSLAFALFALLLWSALDVRGLKNTTPNPKTRTPLAIILTLLCLQIVLGAFLAGLHGGLIYNTFPTMNGVFLPEEALQAPFLHNIATIQFLHRWLAVIIILSYGFWWFAGKLYAMKGMLGTVLVALPLVALLQVGLGIMTLLLQAPLFLALAHQCTGLVLFALTVTALHGLCHAADAHQATPR